MLKSKFTKLFLILGVIFFSLVGVVGCSKSGDSNSVDATYISTYFADNHIDGQFKVVNNHIDLVTLLENDTPEKYNDDYFETKSLLVFKIIESSSGNKSEIESYTINDKALNVYVKTKQYGDVCDEGHWWFMLELSKDEVETFENVKIFKNGEEIMSDEKINNSTEIENKKAILFKLLSFDGDFIGLIGNETISNIFFSKNEMISEFSKYEIIWNDVPLWEKLSDNYFEEKAIVAYFYWIGGSNVERNVNSLTIDDSILEINLVEKVNESYILDDLLFFPILLEVSKEEINFVEEILLKTNDN